jgi:hypothetical protein
VEEVCRSNSSGGKRRGRGELRVKVRGSCSAVQWDGGLGNVTGIRRGTHLHVWGSACVFGSLPDALTLFTLPLASTASLLRCERREAKREREIVGGGSTASATGASASPIQNWTLWPTLVPLSVLFSFPFAQRVLISQLQLSARQESTRRVVVAAGGHGTDGGADLLALHLCLPYSSSESQRSEGFVLLAGWLAGSD